MWFIYEWAFGEWHKVQDTLEGAPAGGFARHEHAKEFMNEYLSLKFSEMTEKGLEDKYKINLALGFKIEFVEK